MVGCVVGSGVVDEVADDRICDVVVEGRVVGVVMDEVEVVLVLDLVVVFEVDEAFEARCGSARREAETRTVDNARHRSVDTVGYMLDGSVSGTETTRKVSVHR